MVVAHQLTPPSSRQEKLRDIELPIIDLMAERSEVSKLIVKASENFGFFKVINHGVPQQVIKAMEDESYGFFSKPASQKQRAGPTNPYGYGCKNIGINGDYGEVEYLLLHTNPLSIFQRSNTISNDPTLFRWAVNGYMEAVRELACEILELMAEGLRVSDTSVFSNFLRDSDSDSLLRLNHYPPLQLLQLHNTRNNRIGFGEHTDPQILTILRSNDVPGLQISPHEDGSWVPVSPHPSTAFCVNVGDALQALTNGRFLSVRHRAMVNSCRTRMSMAYFGAPATNTRIACSPELLSPHKTNLYRPFTWDEYKKATYSRKLGDTRLHFFRVQSDHDDLSE
ncbi:gibberellin 2-beta-dioxygenase 2-like [Lycium barbarum]|uniref:gibberellin 2-beta-dioxygenase 2-like n=1 Tax=Lycium barbarum TaxID=112863 RepID=UPI00293F38A0|nr:gibberellin 2-beta-dioxygenase 2-like [Lycium barbarum]